MKIKFDIGDKVIHDGEEGEVQSFHADASGIRYTITSREVDMEKKEIIYGIKTVTEDELQAV